MSESKHTPGPWSLPHFAEPDVNCQCGYVLSGEGMGAVCTVHASGEGDDWQRHGDNPKFAEAVANAHLISSAPEMLEAIKKVDGHLSILLGNIHGSAKVDHRWEGMEDVVRGWRDEIKFAIAKAEGRS